MALKIYTKTGDKGKTSLYGGKKLFKSELRIEAYGTVDEANSLLGLLRDFETNTGIKSRIAQIQNDMFIIGSILASVPEKSLALPQLKEAKIKLMEDWIDEFTADLPPLKYFIIPGGHKIVSFCHLARTVVRRAERRVVALHIEEEVNPLIIQYLNRLSDLLFVYARHIGSILGAPEVPWIPDKE